MSEVPYDLDRIERTLGGAARSRAERKRRGGDSAARGFRFEIGVCVRILLAFAAKHAAPNLPLPEDTVFWEQPLGFVDDLMVRETETYFFFQFKTGTGVRWSSDQAALRRDFNCQLRLMKNLDLPCSAVLIVDNQKVSDGLTYQQDGPAHPVWYMPAVALPQQAWEDDDLRGSVRALLGKGKLARIIFEPSLVYNFCRAFKSAWDDADGRASLGHLMVKASANLCGLVWSGEQSVQASLLSALQEATEADFEQIGRCIVLHDGTGDVCIMSFSSVEEITAFLELLLDAPGGATIDDVFRFKAWWDEQIHSH